MSIVKFSDDDMSYSPSKSTVVSPSVQTVRKESTMTQMTMEHVTAVVHAEYFLNEQLHKFMEPHQKKQCEDDLSKLAELKLHIIGHVGYENDLFEEEMKNLGHRD